MGRIASWLGLPKALVPQGSLYNRPEFDQATPQLFDAERMHSLRRAFDSRALGPPVSDYLRLASSMTGVVYLSVNLISTLVANSELTFSERDDSHPDGKVRLDRDDPICQLYANPNRVDTSFDLLYQQTQQLELCGMAAVWAPPDRDPNRYSRVEVSELWSLPRASLIWNPATYDYPQGAWTVVPYGAYSATGYGFGYAGAKIPAEQVMLIRKQHPYLRWEGLSVLSAMFNSIETLNAIDRARLSTQQQGTEQSVAVEFDSQVLQPDKPTMDRIKAEWFANYSGPENAGKIVFLGGGAKINPFATKPAEMAWESGWDQVAEYWLSANGTTKALLGMTEGMTHSTLYGSLKANYHTKLDPLLNMLCQRHDKDILHPYYGPDICMELEAEAIHDDELLETQLSNDMRSGIRTVAEVRRERGLESTGEEWEKERAWYGGAKAEGKPPLSGRDKDDAERAELADVERPENAAGRGSLGPRGKSFGEYWKGSGDRNEAMMAAFEGLKSKGVIGELEHRNGKVQVPTN